MRIIIFLFLLPAVTFFMCHTQSLPLSTTDTKTNPQDSNVAFSKLLSELTNASLSIFNHEVDTVYSDRYDWPSYEKFCRVLYSSDSINKYVYKNVFLDWLFDSTGIHDSGYIRFSDWYTSKDLLRTYYTYIFNLGDTTISYIASDIYNYDSVNMCIQKIFNATSVSCNKAICSRSSLLKYTTIHAYYVNNLYTMQIYKPTRYSWETTCRFTLRDDEVQCQ